MSVNGRTSLWSRNFSLLFFSNFFLFFASEMLSPVLPVYLLQNGANNTEIGLIMGCFTLAAIVMRVISIKATDSFGTRTFLIIFLWISLAAVGGNFFAGTVASLCILRMLHGLGFGATTPIYGALASNAIPEARMGEGMGIFGLGITVAAAVGPFLGTTIVDNPNYSWVFLLSAGMIGVAWLLIQFTSVGYQTNVTKQPVQAIAVADFIEVKSLVPSFLALIFGVSFSGMFVYMALFGREAKIDHIGVFFLVTSLAEFIIRPLAGKLYDKQGHLIVLVPGAILAAMGTVILAVTVNLPMLFGAAFCYGLGVGMLFPVLEAWALKAAPPDRRIAASSTFYNFLDIGVGLGAVVLGRMAQLTNYTTMYLYSSFVFGVFLAVYLSYYFFYNKTANGSNEIENSSKETIADK